LSLQVDGLNFSYGSRKVLDDVSFSVDENCFVSILGPNGVGKTTLLKCLCGIHRPQAGSIMLDDMDVMKTSASEMAKVIAYVPQRFETAHNTVFDSVLIGRKPHMSWDSSRTDIDKTWDALESLGLDRLSMDYTDEISGGELQKVNIARAIVQEPRVLVLDEPSNNLDLANQHRVLKLIRDVSRDRGMIAIMTMHDINLSLYYSDRFIFIGDGSVLSSGGSETIVPDVIKSVYGMESRVIDVDGCKVVVPYGLNR
jgi:iron complex transport system ATP-binding protein